MHFHKRALHEGEPPDEIVYQNIGRLHGLNETATVELRVINSPVQETARSYFIAITPTGVFLEEEPLTEATLVATLSYETLLRLAADSQSASQAYLSGHVTLKGDLDLAQRIAQKLSESAARPIVKHFTVAGA
jgi:ubiquinone biosynthesis protein UbiJ